MGSQGIIIRVLIYSLPCARSLPRERKKRNRSLAEKKLDRLGGTYTDTSEIDDTEKTSQVPENIGGRRGFEPRTR